MRILHTSDWHLGRTLHGQSRAAEHEQLIDELVLLAREVDLVLVAGDVFENSNPPIEAERLYFDALARLGDGGRRTVVVIAGNHDSPDRLAACAALAKPHGVHVVARRPAEPLRFDLPCGERAIVGALPYPSEARLGEVLTESLDDEVRQRAYSARVREIFGDYAAAFEPGAVNVLTSHLAVRSCMPSNSERPLVGGAWQVDGEVFPPEADYVALGHLHLAQAVPDAAPLTRYSGSPLAMRFSERDYPRSHVIVHATPGGQPQVELVPVSAGRDLVVWQARSIAEVEQGAAEGRYDGAYIDLELHLPSRPTASELARVRALGPKHSVRPTPSAQILRIRAVLPESNVQPMVAPAGRHEWPISELFEAFYREQTGLEPAKALTELFVGLSSEEGGGVEPAPEPALQAG